MTRGILHPDPLPRGLVTAAWQATVELARHTLPQGCWQLQILPPDVGLGACPILHCMCGPCAAGNQRHCALAAWWHSNQAATCLLHSLPALCGPAVFWCWCDVMCASSVVAVVRQVCGCRLGAGQASRNISVPGLSDERQLPPLVAAEVWERIAA